MLNTKQRVGVSTSASPAFAQGSWLWPWPQVSLTPWQNAAMRCPGPADATQGEVALRVRKVADGCDWMEFTVSDTGVGMTAEQSGEAVPGIQPGRLFDGEALRRDRTRPCPLAQARTHDGRRRDRGERAGQGVGVHAAPAGRRKHLSRMGSDQLTLSRANVCTRRKRRCGPQGGNRVLTERSAASISCCSSEAGFSLSERFGLSLGQFLSPADT